MAAGTVVKLFVSSGPKMVKVPDVKGQTESSAANLLRSKGFQVTEVAGCQLVQAGQHRGQAVAGPG